MARNFHSHGHGRLGGEFRDDTEEGNVVIGSLPLKRPDSTFAYMTHVVF